MRMDRRAVTQTVVDVISVVVLVAVAQAIQELEPVQRGFWCNDDTIKYPSQPETVPDDQLNLICMLLPALFILVSEIIYHQAINRSKLFLTDQEFWYHLISTLTSWLFVFFINVILTTFIKVRSGRLRPIFLDQCRPTVSCSDPVNAGRYITNYTCTTGHTISKFVRTSFPSGHSSETMVSMVFLAIYIYKRYHYDSFRYLTAIVQIAAVLTGLYVALSRIYDNIHHWQDVIAGIILGTLIAVQGTLLPGRLDRIACYGVEGKFKANNVEPFHGIH